MSDYNPLHAVRRAIRSMNRAVKDAKATPAIGEPRGEPPRLALSTTTVAIPCVVLLKTLLEDGPVPDDFTAIPKKGSSLRAHVRPDGAVYKGAFELQGHPDSVCIVYGDDTMTLIQAERMATMERPALTKRHDRWALGPFAPAPLPPPVPASPLLD